MHITQWAEYGIHCCLRLAEAQDRSESSVGAAEIAAINDFSVEYAQQVLQRLRRGGLVQSIRGPSGGYRLARPASEISLFDILLATEGTTFDVICETKPLNAERCAPGGFCCVRDVWHDLRDHVNAFLKQRSLAGLYAESRAGLLRASSNLACSSTIPSSDNNNGPSDNVKLVQLTRPL